LATLRILGEDDVRALIDTDSALVIARAQLLDQARGLSTLSVPAAMDLDARALGGPRFKFKAATASRLGASGIRLIRRATEQAAASHYCAVYRHADSALSGLVSEMWLSRIRTAAFGAVVAAQLANPGPLVVALLGSGAIADEIVPMLARTLEVADLRVHARNTDRLSGFVARHAGACGFPVRAEASCERALAGADVVITLTAAATPLVFAPLLKPGAVVCSMGNDNELDYGVLVAAQRLVVDDADFASEAGDGGAWIAQGHLSREQFDAHIDALACEVVAGTRPGRLAKSDRIVALIQGMAIGDIAFAAHALNEAERRKLGLVVELPAGTKHA
jgi:ornithine cyclodeaminase/alanine dehydrogenase-like protein (mu-crystallin family)